MTQLEKETISKYEKFVKEKGEAPTMVQVVMTWKEREDNERLFIEDYVSLEESDINNEDDDCILFYFGSLVNMLCGLAKLDDSKDYDKQDESVYLSGEFEFNIVKVIKFI